MSFIPSRKFCPVRFGEWGSGTRSLARCKRFCMIIVSNTKRLWGTCLFEPLEKDKEKLCVQPTAAGICQRAGRSTVICCLTACRWGSCLRAGRFTVCFLRRMCRLQLMMGPKPFEIYEAELCIIPGSVMTTSAATGTDIH